MAVPLTALTFIHFSRVKRALIARQATEWEKANAGLRRIWDRTPEGAAMIRRMLDAVAALRASQPANKGSYKATFKLEPIKD